MLKNVLVIGLAISLSINLFASQEPCKIVRTGAGAVGVLLFGTMAQGAWKHQLNPLLGGTAGTMAVVAFVYTANNVRTCYTFNKRSE